MCETSYLTMARNTLNRLVEDLDSFDNFAVYILFFFHSVCASMKQNPNKQKPPHLKPRNSSLTNPFPLSSLALQNTLILLTLTYTLN